MADHIWPANDMFDTPDLGELVVESDVIIVIIIYVHLPTCNEW